MLLCSEGQILSPSYGILKLKFKKILDCQVMDSRRHKEIPKYLVNSLCLYNIFMMLLVFFLKMKKKIKVNRKRMRIKKKQMKKMTMRRKMTRPYQTEKGKGKR